MHFTTLGISRMFGSSGFLDRLTDIEHHDKYPCLDGIVLINIARIFSGQPPTCVEDYEWIVTSTFTE